MIEGACGRRGHHSRRPAHHPIKPWSSDASPIPRQHPSASVSGTVDGVRCHAVEAARPSPCRLVAGAAGAGGCHGPLLRHGSLAPAAGRGQASRRLPLHRTRLPHARPRAWRPACRRPYRPAPPGWPGRAVQPPHPMRGMRQQTSWPAGMQGIGVYFLQAIREKNRLGVRRIRGQNEDPGGIAGVVPLKWRNSAMSVVAHRSQMHIFAANCEPFAAPIRRP